VGGRVECQRAHGQHRGPFAGTAPGQGPQSGQQLDERERFHEIVVRPHVQPAHPVLDRIASGQHQHGRPVARGAKVRAEPEAIPVGEHHVQDQGVVGALGRVPARVLDGRRGIHRVAVGPQAALQQAAQAHVVLEEQELHGMRSVGGWAADGRWPAARRASTTAPLWRFQMNVR
jgi:hypothetical protein